MDITKKGGREALLSLASAIVHDLRIPRILHYIALTALGLVLHLRTHPQAVTLDQIPLFLTFIVALTLAAVFAIVTNNIEDLEADRYSNPDRPLVTGKVQAGPYLWAGIVCQLAALVLALSVSRIMFWGIFAISAGYFLYSCKPFRLKRIPILAKLIIGINSLVMAFTGFMLAGGRFADFPVVWMVFILLPLSLAANFVDLKDTTGDGKTGVRTLPVILGEKTARRLIAFFTLATYVTGGLLLNMYWVYPLMLLLAIAHIFFLFKIPFDERPVFLIYLTAILGLDVFLLFSKSAF